MTARDKEGGLYITLDDFEQRLMVNGLTAFRNDLLRANKPTEGEMKLYREEGIAKLFMETFTRYSYDCFDAICSLETDTRNRLGDFRQISMLKFRRRFWHLS